MLATKFKLMSRVMGSYVYMGKVTEAAQAAEEYKDLIRDCAKMDLKQEELKGRELEELKEKKEEYRTYTLLRAYKSARVLRDESLRVNRLGKKAAKADKDLVEEKRTAFIKDLEELLRADDAVGDGLKYGDKLGEVKQDEEGKKEIAKNDKVYSVKNNTKADFDDLSSSYTSYA